MRGTAGSTSVVSARATARARRQSGLRVYGQGFIRDGLRDGLGAGVDDGYSRLPVGFRVDFGVRANTVTLQGDLFEQRFRRRCPATATAAATSSCAGAASLTTAPRCMLQAYYDQFRRRFQLAADALETIDFETQYNRTQGAHEIVAGFGFRTTHDQFTNNANMFGLDPTSRRLWILQRLCAGPLRADARAFADRRDQAGTLIVHAAWSCFPTCASPGIRGRTTSSGRPCRAPCARRRGSTATSSPRRFSWPRPNFRSEKLIAFEAGYRGQPSDTTSLSISVFYNLYDDIRTAEFIGNPLPVRLSNNLTGHTYGLKRGETGRRCPGGG